MIKHFLEFLDMGGVVEITSSKFFEIRLIRITMYIPHGQRHPVHLTEFGLTEQALLDEDFLESEIKYHISKHLEEIRR